MRKIRKFIAPVIALTAFLTTSLLADWGSKETTEETSETVEEAPVVGISIYKQPNRTVYYVGETFDIIGIIVSINFNNGGSLLFGAALLSTQDWFEISPLGPLTLDDDRITFTYDGSFSTNVYITVYEPASN